MTARTFGPYPAVVVAIHDGDTLSVDIVLSRAGKLKGDTDLGFNVHRRPTGTVLANQHVRLFGCNAAELATDQGKAALAHLLTLVNVGDAVVLVSHGVDKFGGRVDGSVTLKNGLDLAATMIADGYAAVWDGVGAKPVPLPAS